MKGIIWHWTGGSHNVGKKDKKHYHEIIAGNGVSVLGDWPISANEKIVKGQGYAAHTFNSNTGFIGLAIACMAGATKRPLTYGKYPPTKKQVDELIISTAHYCRVYNIPVSRTTTLSHAEVQTNLGIKQRGKWDIIALPWLKKKGALAVGDYLRARVKTEIKRQQLNEEKQTTVNTTSTPKKRKKLPILEAVIVAFLGTITFFFEKLIELLQGVYNEILNIF